jgi:uncharacterized protein YdeI (YjbR/CyaY-like superfamily)
MAKAANFNEYIANSAPFAQEILTELRTVVNNYCPECKEELKWSFPNFTYKGSILCSMAAFKQHCSFGFWLEGVMTDEHGIFKRNEGGMGSLGKLQSKDDLPSADILGAYILQAMSLVDSGAKIKKAPTTEEKKKLEIPEILTNALKKDKPASETFEGMSYSHKKEYAEWINGAKTEATALRRLETTLSNLREGKSKEWKYQK